MTAVATPIAAYRILVAIIRFDFTNVVNFASECLDCRPSTAMWILFRGEIIGIRASLTLALFSLLPAAVLANWAERSVAFRGHPLISNALSDRRPLLILHVTFSANYYGLLGAHRMLEGMHTKERPMLHIAVPRLGAEALSRTGLLNRLMVSKNGSKPRVIVADVPSAFTKMVRALRAGGVVMARVDSLPTTTASFVLTTLFGRPSAFSASLIQAAALSEATVAVAATYDLEGGSTTEFLDAFEVTSSASDDMAAAASRIVGSIERVVLGRGGVYPWWFRFFESNRLAGELVRAASHPCRDLQRSPDGMRAD